MFIQMPDPHPGRCPNLRQHYSISQGLQYLRCLDYANTPHTCSFDIPVERPDSWTGNFQSYSTGTAAAVRWIKPPPKPDDDDGTGVAAVVPV